MSHNYLSKNPPLSLISRMEAALFGSFIVSLTVTPFDMAKTRLQAQTSKNITHIRCFNGLCEYWTSPCQILKDKNGCPRIYKNTFDLMYKVVKQEGFFSLWRGLFPTIIYSIPTTVLYFSFYDYFNENMVKNGMSHFYSPLIAGVSSRIGTSSIVAPLELIRTKIQATSTISEGTRQNIFSGFNSVKKVIRFELQKGGISRLWRGLGPTLLRDVPFSGIYWTLYETFKKTLFNFSLDNGSHVSSFSRFITTFFAGALSGSLASIITLPFDVIKTRRQVELYSSNSISSSTSYWLKHIIQNDGFKGLFVGIVPRVMKVAPACAIMISNYELFKYLLGKRNQTKIKK